MSLISAISEVLRQGDTLTFRKNPLCHLDPSHPEAQDVSMTLKGPTAERGDCSYNINWNMQVVKDDDKFIIDGLKTLVKSRHKREQQGDQRHGEQR